MRYNNTLIEKGTKLNLSTLKELKKNQFMISKPHINAKRMIRSLDSTSKGNNRRNIVIKEDTSEVNTASSGLI